MKLENKRCPLMMFMFFCSLACLFFFCPDSFASEELSSGRRLWDNAMLWVNFAVLVLVFLKFGKKPLMDFLHGVRRDIETDINDVEGRYKSSRSLMDEEADSLKKIEEHLEQIQQDIVEMGKREKEKIIAQAKTAAEKLIKDAKTYSLYRMETAKKALADEMVDIAVSMVEDRLSKGISTKDNDQLVNQFLTDLKTSKQSIS